MDSLVDSRTDSLTRLGRYRLVRTLGQGGMARVYLARMFGASGFETEVAIKVLLPAFGDAGPYQRALIEEARLGARLRHRNLVAVHDLGVDKGVYYVCMEYVDGADLATLATRAGHALPAGLALLIAEEIAHALEYVYRLTDERGRPLGLVHRDVSPANILISRAGEVKLADFGVAKATMLADVTQSNLRKGKYAYMSPEQVAGEALTAVSDQFGLGITLAELLCGERPFDGATVMETLDNIKAAKPPALGSLDAGGDGDVAAIIRRCLAREPDDRFASAAELGRALAEARRLRAVITPTDLGAWVEAHMADRPPARTDAEPG